MSITPDVTDAKVGDTVVFTIVTKNYGPGPAPYMWVNTNVTNSNPVGYANCGGINQPAPPLNAYGADGSACEVGWNVPPGATMIDSVVTQIQPTSAGSTGDTACPIAPVPPLLNNVTVGCKTATVAIDGATCPVPGASQTIGGHTYALEGEDTFTKNAPLGSFAQSPAGIADANSLPVVYTGDHGMGWTSYPDTWPSTYTKPPYVTPAHEGYQPSTVVSVNDGVLDFYPHRDYTTDPAGPGYPVGASLSPLPGGSRYQTYGAWSLCELVPSTFYPGFSPLTGFRQAPLLWPYNDSDWQSAESDFPEGDLTATPAVDAANQLSAFAHYGGAGAQDIFDFAAQEPGFNPNAWHEYTQTWGPGFRCYYVDGAQVGCSTHDVWPNEERWQLQVEPAISPQGVGYGHVYVKWVWIGSY